MGFAGGTSNYVSNLASGLVLSAGQGRSYFASGTLAVSTGYTNSQFVVSDGFEEGFIGFRFDDGASGFQYGWVRLTGLPDEPANSYRIEEYAYADAGEAITVGQTSAVPEPSSLGLLALGAVGVLASRRKKSALAS